MSLADWDSSCSSWSRFSASTASLLCVLAAVFPSREIRKQPVIYKTIADTKWQGFEVGLPRHAVRVSVRQSGLEIVPLNIGNHIFPIPSQQHYLRGREATMCVVDGPFDYGGPCIELFGNDDTGAVHLFLQPTDDMDELWEALLAAGVQPIEPETE